jgi:S-adenosylmethionine:tRNA ribosyltransferase-isomerase
MELSDYGFQLPEELIAQQPLEERSSSRMLVIDRSTGTFSDSRFRELSSRMRPSDLLVVNNTRVFPARLLGRSETGARVELFLIEESDAKAGVWITLAKPARRLKGGKKVFFSDRLSADVLERSPDGKLVVRFNAVGPLDEALEEVGRTPLPPYIGRDPEGPDIDRERYQTVYAARRGAIAAPTAGLHFSPEMFEALRDRGVETAEITLHVGYGTFEPVRVSDITQHRVAAERFVIDEAAAEALERARADGRRIVAVGTTTTRTLEFYMNRFGKFSAASGTADLTILPGYRFRAVDALITNFHLPESSLLIMVATFGGYELIMKAYRHAVASRYRFYSYGDCMLIE